jgi:hypothetical protein
VRRGIFSWEAISSLPQPCSSKSTICCSRGLSLIASCITPPFVRYRGIFSRTHYFSICRGQKAMSHFPACWFVGRNSGIQLFLAREIPYCGTNVYLNQRWALLSLKCRTACVAIARLCMFKSGSQSHFGSPTVIYIIVNCITVNRIKEEANFL